MIRMPFPASTWSTIGVNLLSRSRIRNLKWPAAFAEVHEQVAGLLRGPRSGGAGGDARDVHPPGLDLHHEEDVQACEEHGVSVQEVARQYFGRLRGKELPPGRRHPAWRGAETGRGQDPANRSLTDAVAEADELALDAPVPVGAGNRVIRT